MKTHALYVAGAALMIALSSCDRDLDLAHAYNNGSSSKPYEFDADFNPDDYTDFGTFVVGDRNICWQDPHIPRYMLWLDGKISVGKYCLRPTGLRTIPCDRYPPVPGSMRTSMP